MKKEYLIILSILVGSIILATATYIEKCKKAARFENLGN